MLQPQYLVLARYHCCLNFCPIRGTLSNVKQKVIYICNCGFNNCVEIDIQRHILRNRSDTIVTFDYLQSKPFLGKDGQTGTQTVIERYQYPKFNPRLGKKKTESLGFVLCTLSLFCCICENNIEKNIATNEHGENEFSFGLTQFLMKRFLGLIQFLMKYAESS